jgi:hypothetical protein
MHAVCSSAVDPLLLCDANKIFTSGTFFEFGAAVSPVVVCTCGGHSTSILYCFCMQCLLSTTMYQRGHQAASTKWWKHTHAAASHSTKGKDAHSVPN